MQGGAFSGQNGLAISLVLSLVQVPAFLGAGARHFGFMLRGLRELQGRLQEHGIPFFLTKASQPHAQ